MIVETVIAQILMAILISIGIVATIKAILFIIMMGGE